MSAANTNQEPHKPTPGSPGWSPVRAANEVLWRELAKVYVQERTSQPGAVVFYGTSTIRLWKSLQKDFPEFRSIGIGLPAANLNVLLRFYDELIAPLEPSKLVLYAGTTEAMKGRPHIEISDGLDALCSRARERNPDLPITLLSLAASPAVVFRWRAYAHANQSLAAYAAVAQNVTFIDAATPLAALPEARQISLICDDHIHFTREGFGVYADLLRPVLATPLPIQAAAE
jgi:hypothetical protein